MREIRTSDRNSFRRCRRKFALSSALKMNLEAVGSEPIHFWLGSGFHYAMEDFYGYNRHQNPQAAFKAYIEAHRAAGTLPEGWEESAVLCRAMIDNYVTWSQGLADYKTVWIDDVPMVEVKLSIPLPELGPDVYYSATIDRLASDVFGNLWIVDYKTAARYDNGKLMQDPQITAYHWALKKQYGIDAAGMIYIQILKTPAASPQVLKSGKLSQSKSQGTTYGLYIYKLAEMYGDHIPDEYTEHLHWLKEQDTWENNQFVKVDFVTRNKHQIIAEEKKIMAEGKEMLDSATPMYPNPTRDCPWDCRHRTLCIALDDGSDAQFIADNNFRQKAPDDDSWRKRVRAMAAEDKSAAAAAIIDLWGVGQ